MSSCYAELLRSWRREAWRVGDMQLLQRHQVLELLLHSVGRAVQEEHVAFTEFSHVANGFGPHAEQNERRVDVV